MVRQDRRRLGAGSARRVRRLLPRTFQARLTLGLAGIVALTLGVAGMLIINRVDDYFDRQTRADLNGRAKTVHDSVLQGIETALDHRELVVAPDGTVNPTVITLLRLEENRRLLADIVAQANVEITIGQATRDSEGNTTVVATPSGRFEVDRTAGPIFGQTPDPITTTLIDTVNPGGFDEYGLEVQLSDPYTFRASAVANTAAVLAIVGLAALLAAFIVAAVVAQRLTIPIRRLTDASRAISEGDYTRRVPANLAGGGAVELAELSQQFNVMAARLGESIEIIRRDRDRSRDFLADVSHELRTPIAALRTFNELLRETAAADPEARAEFLESSRQQIERLDWLAQNLLELSKLDSGLVLLDLRPDDLRACVESAVQQAEAGARRRGISLSLDLPIAPLRVRHDPQRIGQVVTNLVGNALKFTPRGGRVTVRVVPDRAGARIVVADTGVGIDSSELPRIFDRFYRGSSANEARGSGSGLGLAIVKSIVDMHGGRVSVESLVGQGATFTVTLPRDPQSEPVPEVDLDGAGGSQPNQPVNVVDSSPTAGLDLNQGPPPLHSEPPADSGTRHPASIAHARADRD